MVIVRRRDDIFAALKKIYYDTTGKNLPIYSVPCAKLKEYETSKKDMKKGVEIIPEELHRVTSEDHYDETGVKSFGTIGATHSGSMSSDSSG